MNPTSNAQCVFLQAVESVPQDEWPRFVEEACAGDDVLRRKVTRLLDAHRLPGPFMDHSHNVIDILSATVFPVSNATVGAWIGPYKLLEQIGEGGMGVVYVAEQVQPIRRRVALKIIKPGMDSRHVVARFEAERQALAMMDHPNIATVLDAGVSDAGLPYFVMELVRGVPITEYCDTARLSPERRLELFATVCQAVQHAHQKGIIHRDIKPSNVMVTLHDGRPVPKIIDFGIAKAIDHRLTEKTVYTAFALMIGTPLYMSPEQAELSGLDVDTRSDVYSLGVLLYELLTGTTPFDSGTLSTHGLDEVRRIIREYDPPRPSTRVSTLNSDSRTNLCVNRGLDERRLGQVLSGELDWIVMRALEKDRNRRYESASAFASDILRYLHDEPVEACPQSAAYRLLKFTRRYRLAVVVTILMVSTLTVGAGIATWQAVVANHERIRANEFANQAIKEAQNAAQKTLVAEQQMRRAEAAELEQRRQADRAEDVIYASAIRLASRHEQAGDDEQAQRLLDAWLPSRHRRDRRGLEWRLLQRGLHLPQEDLLQLPGDVSSLRISPNGDYLVTATDGGTIHRYSFTERQPLMSWETGLTDVRRIEFSADGSYLAVISYEAEAVLVDTTSGSVKLRCPPPSKPSDTPDVAFFDGRLITTAQVGTVEVWNIEQGTRERSWAPDCSGILDVVIASSPPKLVLLTGHEGLPTYQIQFFSDFTKTAAESPICPKCGASAVDLSPDDKHLAVGGRDGEVEIWDLAASKQVASWRVTEKINELRFSDKGDILGAAERTGVVHLWRWRARIAAAPKPTVKTHVHWQAHGRPARTIEFSRDSRHVITGGIDGRIIRWSWDQPANRRLPTPRRDCRDLLALAGAGAVATLDSQQLNLFDLKSGNLLSKQNFPLPADAPDARRLAADESGQWLAVAVESKDILCGDLRRGYALEQLPNSASKEGANMLAFLPGRTTLIAVDSRPSLRVRGWNVEQRNQLFDRRFESMVPVWTMPANRGDELFSLTKDGLARIHLLSGKVEDVWRTDGEDIACAAVSSDGKLLAIGYKSRALTLVNTETGTVHHTLLGHLGSFSKLQFTPDGQTLLALDFRGHLRFWHVSSGTELLTWPSPSPIQRFDLSADGRWLTIARLGEIEVFDTSDVANRPK